MAAQLAKISLRQTQNGSETPFIFCGQISPALGFMLRSKTNSHPN